MMPAPSIVLTRGNGMSYSILQHDQILNRWKNVHGDIGLYIHNPFCSSICSFCSYRGVPYKQPEFGRYYTEYLPKQIKSYQSVLESQSIKSLFFGGGTPSLVEPNMLESIFEQIPNFQTIPSKIFEFHPGIFYLDHIPLLNKYNFHTILCVQTFEENLLKKMNRPAYSFETVKELRKKFNNGYVLLDLIAFTHEPLGTEIFFGDIHKSMMIQPDEISIAFDFRYRDNQDLDKYAQVLAVALNMYSYFIEGVDLDNKKYEERVSTIRSLLDREDFSRVLRIIRRDVGMDKYRIAMSQVYNIMTYNLASKSSDFSTLGIGSFNNPCMDTFSVINNDLVYIESNENWQPKYYEVYDETKQKQLPELIDEFYEIIKPAGKIPANIEFGFKPMVFIDYKGKYQTFTKKLVHSIKPRDGMREDSECMGFIKKVNGIMAARDA